MWDFWLVLKLAIRLVLLFVHRLITGVNCVSRFSCHSSLVLRCLFNSRKEHNPSRGPWSAHLIIFGAGLQQTLLYGKLEQILLLLPHAVSLFASQQGVTRWGLKHTRGNFSCSTWHCSTQGKVKGKRWEGYLMVEIILEEKGRSSAGAKKKEKIWI